MHASFSLEAPLISCCSIQAETQKPDLARPGVTSTPALKPVELPGPCPPQLQPDSPGHHKTDAGCGRSDGDRLLGHLHRRADCTHSHLPTPATLPQKTALSVFPAQPLLSGDGHPLSSYTCLPHFSKRGEKVKFSLVSPRESELRGKQHP